MDKTDIRLGDWQRILLGNAPVEFLLEVVVRTIITYAILLLVVKWFGKRLSGQLSIAELGITIMLGAIVAPPMETPERGIAQGALILLSLLAMHQWLGKASAKNARLNKLVHGTTSILIKDGLLELATLNVNHITRAQIFAVLREEHIYNLGEVKRLYMETSGLFSVYQADEPRPGLSLLPPEDDDIHDIQRKPSTHLKACTSCGNVIHTHIQNMICNRCGAADWDAAVM